MKITHVKYYVLTLLPHNSIDLVRNFYFVNIIREIGVFKVNQI
jgi:hypothetical protein